MQLGILFLLLILFADYLYWNQNNKHIEFLPSSATKESFDSFKEEVSDFSIFNVASVGKIKS